MSILDRIATLLEERKRLLPLLVENARTRDPRGVSTACLIDTHRFIGIASYSVNGNAVTFRRELSASAEIQLALLDRFDAGEEISPSYAAITGGYQALLSALAASNDELSLALAKKIGGREAIERKNDHPFDRTFGYALKAAVLESSDFGERVSAFAAEMAKPGNKDFAGYPDALAKLGLREHGNIESIFDAILAGHRRQSKGRGIFKDTADEALCVWGLAIANLMGWKAAQIDVDDPLLPRTLLRTTPS